MTAKERTCQNIRPGADVPCGCSADDEITPGRIDVCPECRAAASLLCRALAAVMTDRAAKLMAVQKAA